MLGAVAAPQTQQAVGQQDARLEEGGIEVERGAVGAHRVLRAVAEVVEEAQQGVGGGLGRIGRQDPFQDAAGVLDAVLRKLAGGGHEAFLDAAGRQGGGRLRRGRRSPQSCGGPRDAPVARVLVGPAGSLLGRRLGGRQGLPGGPFRGRRRRRGRGGAGPAGGGGG